MPDSDSDSGRGMPRPYQTCFEPETGDLSTCKLTTISPICWTKSGFLRQTRAYVEKATRPQSGQNGRSQSSGKRPK